MLEFTRLRVIPGIGLIGLVAALAAPLCVADPEYRTVEGAGGVPLNVVTAGDPELPAILLVHGIGQSHYSFARQFDSALSEDYFLVAFDLRGHGASGKPWTAEAYVGHEAWAEDVAAVIAATGVERPVMVAWSYGTLVAMDYVREHGVGGISGLLLTGALGALKPFAMPNAGDSPEAREFARLREMQVSRNLIDNIHASEQLVSWLTAEPLPDEERERFQEIGLMLPAYARRAMVGRRFDNQDLVEQLALPVLILLGDQENPMLLEQGAELAASRSNMKLSVYEGAGHTVFFEQPQRFNAELRDFAGQVLHSAPPPATRRSPQGENK